MCKIKFACFIVLVLFFLSTHSLKAETTEDYFFTKLSYEYLEAYSFKKSDKKDSKEYKEKIKPILSLKLNEGEGLAKEKLIALLNDNEFPTLAAHVKNDDITYIDGELRGLKKSSVVKIISSEFDKLTKISNKLRDSLYIQKQEIDGLNRRVKVEKVSKKNSLYIPNWIAITVISIIPLTLILVSFLLYKIIIKKESVKGNKSQKQGSDNSSINNKIDVQRLDQEDINKIIEGVTMACQSGIKEIKQEDKMQTESNHSKREIMVNHKTENDAIILYMSKYIKDEESNDCFFPKNRVKKILNKPIYSLTLVDEGATKGRFEFLTEPYAIKEAKRDASNILGGVTETVAGSNKKFNFSSIKTVEAGEVTKKGDRWVVSKKAKISYE